MRYKQFIYTLVSFFIASYSNRLTLFIVMTMTMTMTWQMTLPIIICHDNDKISFAEFIKLQLFCHCHDKIAQISLHNEAVEVRYTKVKVEVRVSHMGKIWWWPLLVLLGQFTKFNFARKFWLCWWYRKQGIFIYNRGGHNSTDLVINSFTFKFLEWWWNENSK